VDSLPLSVTANTLALVTTIGGFVVALAGVISNVVISWLRRGEDLELAEKQHAHERELARGTRLYERRAPLYQRMMAIVQPTMEHVEARTPIVRLSVEPPLPPEPEPDEQREMQIELRTHASHEVGQAFHDYVTKVRSFLLNATTYELTREQTGPSDEVARLHEQMETARAAAREAADTLARLVAEELAAL
jgi:hypothetical protein